MKKVYEKPELLLVLATSEDVITTSTLRLYDSSDGVSRGVDIYYW